MIAKSILSITSYSKGTRGVSIKEVAIKACQILHELAKIDDIFSKPIYTNGKGKTEIYLNNIYAEETIAKIILNTYWNEITRFENNTKPTIDYRRYNEGFSFNAQFAKDNMRRFDISIGIGYENDGVVLSNFNRDFQYEYNWYEKILHQLVKSMCPFYGVVNISDSPTLKFYNEQKIRYLIGWITYFSNDFHMKIPNDLAEVEYNVNKNGVFIYTSHIDFLKDKEGYFINREKLFRVIKELKSRIPEFSRL